ncbi:hypothetical protein SLA2020_132390 [Shorea laevis]
MNPKTLIIAALQQLPMFYFRGMFQQVKAFHFSVVLLCTYFCLTTCEPCSTNGMLISAEYDGCDSYGDDHGVRFQEIVVGDTSMGYISGSPRTQMSIEGVCTDSHSFCFPSTLPGFLPEDCKGKAAALEVVKSHLDSHVESTESRRKATNKSWSSDQAMFKLQNGRIVSCSLNFRDGIHKFSSIQPDGADPNEHSPRRGPLPNQTGRSVGKRNKEVTQSGSFDIASSPNVEISPPVMDWEEKYLFFPSVAYLTVANTCNDSILHVYEPFSTNIQFYPCNFSEILLGPGEVASICFVFLPRWLGLSSAHLILQTSSGGFLVQARGFAVESPYGIKPVVRLDVPSKGRLSKSLSLFNLLDETLYVEETTAWISVSLGNTIHHAEAICSIENFQGHNEQSLLSVENWLLLERGPSGFPLMAMRPQGIWEVNPSSSETVIELDLSVNSQGKIVGAFCMQLLRSSQDKADTLMVPLEADLEGNSFSDVAGSVSVSLEALMPYDSETGVVALSLRNGSPDMLSIVKITELAETKFFHIKYMEGLLLFPGADTQVAVITCSKLPVEMHGSPPEVSNIIRNCKLLVLTNDSINPQIEVPCEDVTHICLKHQKDSPIGHEYQSEKVESGNMKGGSLDGGMQWTSWVKVLRTTEADELILDNWRSQGTASGMSVLDDHEVLFPTVQVGTHFSKWITVKNPSKWPVVIQLILNSGEIIDECQGNDGFIKPLSSDDFVHTESVAAVANGFSLAESAVTEAYVHPHGRASFGPILFHPSNRCGWRSSALIRNNLSGVEWISLRGFGGSYSILLLEGSEPIQSIEFNHSVPVPLNISLLHMFFQTEETTKACNQPFVKELCAKNTGDLPLQVRSIEVSGSECGLDGFMVQNCKGFSLEPGESTKLLISYQATFSAATLCRDLELALATGILVIPMKASLPVYKLNICKKSMFWMRLKKLSIAVLLSASFLFLIFCCIFPQLMVLGSQDCFYESEKSHITTIRNEAKSSHMNQNQRNNKFSVSDMVGLLSLGGEDKLSKQAFNGRHPNGNIGASELGLTAEQGKPTGENESQINSLLETHKENPLPSFLPKSQAAENSDTVEVSQPSHLTIRTGKEKGRRRRKRKGLAAGFTGLVEVSSSQSGNSTPSSPLSPLTSVIPNRTLLFTPDVDQSIEVRNPFVQLADQTCEKVQVSGPPSKANSLESKVSVKNGGKNCYFSTQEKSSVLSKNVAKPVLLPSSTSPCAGRVTPDVFCSPPSVSTSTIAPHARAPGSKLCNLKTIKAEGKTMLRNEYTYDIWGDHFSGLHVTGRSKDVSMNSSHRDNDSDSFFVRGPQALMTKSEPKIVSCLHQEG